MFVTINGASLNVEVFGADDAPVLIAHHGGGGIGSLAEPRATFGPLADLFRVIVFDARGCGDSEGLPPYSHEQWAADDMDPDLMHEHARNQDRVEINWDNFDRYWSGRITDDADLKARWAELIPLYDFDYDPVKSAAAVEAGKYRHESHNWCFQQNMPVYDLKPLLPGVTCPTLVTVGRADWVTPVSAAETIAGLIPDSRLVIFEKSGHSPQIEEFDAFQALMREFLLGVLAGDRTG